MAKKLFKRKGGGGVGGDDDAMSVTSGRSMGGSSVSDRIMGRMRLSMSRSQSQNERKLSSVPRDEDEDSLNNVGGVASNAENHSGGARELAESGVVRDGVNGSSVASRHGLIDVIERGRRRDEKAAKRSRRRRKSAHGGIPNTRFANDDDDEGDPAEHSLSELRSMTESELRHTMINAGLPRGDIEREEAETIYEKGGVDRAERDLKNRLVAMFVNSGRVKLRASRAREQAQTDKGAALTIIGSATATETIYKTKQGKNPQSNNDGTTADDGNVTAEGVGGDEENKNENENATSGEDIGSWVGNTQRESEEGSAKRGNISGDGGASLTFKDDGDSVASIASSSKDNGDECSAQTWPRRGSVSSPASSKNPKKQKEDEESVVSTATGSKKSKLEKILELKSENSRVKLENKSLRKTMKRLLMQLEEEVTLRKERDESEKQKKKSEGGGNDASFGPAALKGADVGDQLVDDAATSTTSEMVTTTTGEALDAASGKGGDGTSAPEVVSQLKEQIQQEEHAHHETSIRLSAEADILATEVSGLQRELNVGIEAAEESDQRNSELRTENSRLRQELRGNVSRLTGMEKEAVSRDQLIETFARVLLQQSKEATMIGMEVGVVNGGSGGDNGDFVTDIDDDGDGVGGNESVASGEEKNDSRRISDEMRGDIIAGP